MLVSLYEELYCFKDGGKLPLLCISKVVLIVQQAHTQTERKLPAA